jgi:hypothetical protein
MIGPKVSHAEAEGPEKAKAIVFNEYGVHSLE